MFGLSGLLWLQKQNRLFNGWFTQSPVDYYIDGARDEIAEIRESLHVKNHDELELEVGDLLWDVLSLINRLDHEKMIDIDRVCPRAVAKFSEWMPYNVLGYREENMKKLGETWNEAKKRQKISGIDENNPLVIQVWDTIQKEESKSSFTKVTADKEQR